MTDELDRARLLALLDDDVELFEALCEAGVLARREAYTAREAESARVARTLVRELDVNLPGVEIIVRMRAELVATQHQIAGLLALLRQLADASKR